MKHELSEVIDIHVQEGATLFNLKTLLPLLLAQKLISSKCVLFKNNLLPSDTVPLTIQPRIHYLKKV